MLNFHNEIALRLELLAKECNLTTIAADDAESSQFVDIMLEILGRNGVSDDAFETRCQLFIGKTPAEIGEEQVRALYEEFNRLYDSHEG